jgi:hypothetical protein
MVFGFAVALALLATAFVPTASAASSDPVDDALETWYQLLGDARSTVDTLYLYPRRRQRNLLGLPADGGLRAQLLHRSVLRTLRTVEAGRHRR